MDFPRSPPRYAYRIASNRHPLLHGEGAFRYGARWNSPGRHAVYAAESYAGALLEILAMPTPAGRRRIWCGCALRSPTLPVEDWGDDPPRGWNESSYAASRRVGDAWLTAGLTAMLTVPSAVTGGVERNLVLNPVHPDFAALELSETRPVVWDQRLYELSSQT